MNVFSQQFLTVIIFLTVIFFHTAKKNVGMAVAYGLQSLAIAFLLLGSFLEKRSLSLLFVVVLVVVIKVIIAPRFFVGLVKKHEVKFSSSAYINFPLTLIGIAALVALAHSKVFLPLRAPAPDNAEQISLAIAGILISLFLMINRKGALSQAVGILSLENCIVAFATLSGLEQSAALQVGIMFDIAVWLIIATVFVSMLYKHFGSLDITEMKSLKD